LRGIFSKILLLRGKFTSNTPNERIYYFEKEKKITQSRPMQNGGTPTKKMCGFPSLAEKNLSPEGGRRRRLGK